ncbi:MAG: hypothetical protein AAF560_12835 [Acidobacteriota bacterium]
MSSRDLTRWNRAGLSRLRYVDGNAATYLEDLRQQLGAAFPDWQTMAATPPAGETDAQRISRLLAQYHGEPSDWGWELARCLARATHILTEHVDAYANEGFLGTAREWENVRHLVEMLGYHVAPPASASTRLAITAESPGLLPAGFQVQHTPADGGAPIVFETLAGLELDPELDALRLAGWNRSREAIGPVGSPAVATRSAADLRDLTFTEGVDLPSIVWVAGLGRAPAAELGLPSSGVEAAAKRATLTLGLEPPPELLESHGTSSLAQVMATSSSELAELRDRLELVREALSDSAFADVRLDELADAPAAEVAGMATWLAEADADLTAGSVALVVREDGDGETAAVVEISDVSGSGQIELETVTHEDPRWRYWPRGEARLLASAADIRRPLLGGQGVVALDAAVGLAGGDVVAWNEGDWQLADVLSAEGPNLRLDRVPPAGAEIYRVGIIPRQADGRLLFPVETTAAARRDSDDFLLLTDDDSEVVEQGAARELVSTAEPEIYLVPAGANGIARVQTQAERGGYLFAGSPGALASGQWVVGDDGERLHALRVRRVVAAADQFSLELDNPPRALPVKLSESVLMLAGVTEAERSSLEQLGIVTVGDLVAHRYRQVRLAGSGITALRFSGLLDQAGIVADFELDRTRFNLLLDSPLPQLFIEGPSVPALLIGQPVAEVEGLLSSLRLLQAAVTEDVFSSSVLGDWGPSAETVGLERIYGSFSYTIRPNGWDRNDTPISGERLRLADPRPELLGAGRELVLEQRDGDALVRAQAATAIGRPTAANEIVIAPEISSDEGWTVGNLVVRANAVSAGHGEQRPSRVLGSGDSAATDQSFVIEEEGLSFVADATQPTGVRAALEVTVAARTWRQVPTLDESGPTDPHFTVRMTEDGYARLTFGDGRRGRRLPTGSNNVRVRLRVGSGLAGNLSSGSLMQPVRPQALVDSVSQPLPATGGNDMESAESMRQGGPASVLTLERAVSLSDFTHLASRQSSVWQARAFARSGGRRGQTRVDVVVVPAGGGELGPLAVSLQQFLQQHAAPGISVQVAPYLAVPFGVEVLVRVRSSEFQPETVLERVRAALLDAFSLRRRGLGQPVYLSEIYQAVESVSGVENSQCTFSGQPGTRRLAAAPEAVLTLEPAAAELTSEEYFQ